MTLFTENFSWYVVPVGLAGLIGSVSVDRDFYKKIQENTPFYTPPPYLFGIIWTLIYIISIFAFALIPDDYWLFIITMIINALWTYVFFKMKQKLLSFILIIIMLVLAIYSFMRINERLVSLENSPDYSTALLITVLFFIYPIWLVIAASLTTISGFV
jgi:tryptophan-rich sensory protein